MKRFLKTYAMCLVVSEVFLFCGGYMLFDFQGHPFRAFAAVAFLIAVLISVWESQEERMDALERRIQAMENPESTKDAEDKEREP